MSDLGTKVPGPIQVRLPATSANLGPGFDALGLAMAFYLTIDASAAEAFAILATGRNADVCGRVEDSLILTTYRSVLADAGHAALPLALTLHNEIPLGMGCGSSAAALLAGVVLANHFGGLGWSGQQVLEEACVREGHPDNVAACWAGRMTCSSMDVSRVVTASCGFECKWKIMVVLPENGLATKTARALLPATYSRADAVANVQSTALLVAAFALERGDLLLQGMRDTLHQPYRMEVCPLLPKLLPLAGTLGILGVALSGAGPSVLLIAEADADDEAISNQVRACAEGASVEIIGTKVAGPHRILNVAHVT
jgi:homoserine kinase